MSTDEVTSRLSPGSPVPRSPAEARREVEFLLHELFCLPESERDEDVLADTLLVTSELVTNALLHGGGITDFEAELTREGLRVSVSDRSDQVPTAPERTDARGMIRVGGHGWPVICRLARSIAITYRAGGGKCVSALVPLA
ncbi:ATP-binding protein [Streptomyces sp. NBC_01794]|uniref:ATP-binding protein n=1 Tax=Streptomyces sp. NBC_01794 TaxID=2975942 RepID=UPI00308BB93D|nr:ATP-binding protein [Streptomyces sp. NBC_01794]